MKQNIVMIKLVDFYLRPMGLGFLIHGLVDIHPVGLSDF